MTAFTRRNGELYAEEVALSAIAERYGTPSYVYSRAAISGAYQAYTEALQSVPHMICYAVKANSNLAVLNLLAKLGAGFDVVSGGELARVLAAGGRADRVVFSGVGKTAEEIRAALAADIHCFNVESIAEIHLLQAQASAMGKRARVSLRVNPDIDAGTHPYISTGLKENKFGIAIDEAVSAYQLVQQQSQLDITGLDCHIGSQLLDSQPFQAALQRMLVLVDECEKLGIHFAHIDLGGGLGVKYRNEEPLSPQQYLGDLLALLEGRSLQVIVEPGRSLVANAGVLLTQVLSLKQNGEKNFAIVDAAMNDYIRPALYDAWVGVEPVSNVDPDTVPRTYDIVGPVCESGDFLARERELCLREGQVLAIRSVGAYGFAMSSNYNSRPRAVELMVDGGRAQVVRARETFEQLIQGESLLAD